jgi:hypothetical protein
MLYVGRRLERHHLSFAGISFSLAGVTAGINTFGYGISENPDFNAYLISVPLLMLPFFCAPGFWGFFSFGSAVSVAPQFWFDGGADRILGDLYGLQWAVLLVEIGATDLLAGRLTRHGFESRSMEVFSHERAGGKPPSVIMIDVDHFKSINVTISCGIATRCHINKRESANCVS